MKFEYLNSKHNPVRNFAIIAHIDHGKSTLADRILEATNTVPQRQMRQQLLDSMEVERTHGITVKSSGVRIQYQATDGDSFIYNLIDTPGHVDFSYEVSKSLAACEGAILLVDATQGVQAQTVANFQLALENNLVLIPVINKIDSPNADIGAAKTQIIELGHFSEEDIVYISARSGLGVDILLERIHQVIPPPANHQSATLEALVIDSHYDSYRGVIAHIRVFSGHVSANENLLFMRSNEAFLATETGYFSPTMTSSPALLAGDVGYVITNIKDPEKVTVGDTLTGVTNPIAQPLAGYKKAQPMVFAGFYPSDGDDEKLRSILHKLILNESSIHLEEEYSKALGAGFRCGFLGMLHLQIIRERLEKEFAAQLLVTAPGVAYRVRTKKGQELVITNASFFPPFEEIAFVDEPIMNVTITLPESQVGTVMQFAGSRKGVFGSLEYKAGQAVLHYEIPASEIAYDFFNRLKSLTRGYAAMETSFKAYQRADIVRLDVQINYIAVDALTLLAHRNDAQLIAAELAVKLKHTVPRKLYPMPVQVLVENRVIGREDIPPLRKNQAVNGEKRSLSKKKELLRRQSHNRKRMAELEISLPQEVFNSLLDVDTKRV